MKKWEKLKSLMTDATRSECDCAQKLNREMKKIQKALSKLKSAH
uniref:Uncharacterized protein n=1 Tax=Rhizophora mucronata TaxID=61149 RepID=A0A2P2NR06_RHIMU